MDKTVWVMGHMDATTPEGDVWSICGVFGEKKDAISYCTVPEDFVAPLILNAFVAFGTGEWSHVEHPIAKEK